MSRKYPFALPYTTTAKDGLAISYGLNLPAVHAAIPRLKPKLVTKLRACTVFHSETFSKADLDSIPDDLWAQIAPHIG